MSKLFAVLFLLATAILVGSFLLKDKKSMVSDVPISTQQIQIKEVDFKAEFYIYTNGTKRKFTDSKYHNKSNEVFIEAENTNLVRVRKTGVTWSNFFETLPMSLKKDCLTTGTNQSFCTGASGTLRFYINRMEDKDALDREIKEDDSLLVEYKG